MTQLVIPRWKRIARMPRRQVALKVLEKGKRLIDVPGTALELQLSRVITTQRTTFEDREILREVKRCLSSGSRLVVFDIGAHKGHYAAAIASATSVGEVVAFEPIPESFDALKQVAKESTKIRPINIALGDKPGSSEFYVNDASASSSFLPMLESHVEHFPHTRNTRRITVEVETLDNVVASQGLPKPNLIKVDVQGFEDRVIAGGKKTFGAARWCLIEVSLVELYDGAGSFGVIYRSLADLGYELREVTSQLRGKNGDVLQMNVLFER